LYDDEMEDEDNFEIPITRNKPKAKHPTPDQLFHLEIINTGD